MWCCAVHSRPIKSAMCSYVYSPEYFCHADNIDWDNNSHSPSQESNGDKQRKFLIVGRANRYPKHYGSSRLSKRKCVGTVS